MKKMQERTVLRRRGGIALRTKCLKGKSKSCSSDLKRTSGIKASLRMGEKMIEEKNCCCT